MQRGYKILQSRNMLSSIKLPTTGSILHLVAADLQAAIFR